MSQSKRKKNAVVCNVSPKSTVILSTGRGIAQQRQGGCGEFKARLHDTEHVKSAWGTQHPKVRQLSQCQPLLLLVGFQSHVLHTIVSSVLDIRAFYFQSGESLGTY